MTATLNSSQRFDTMVVGAGNRLAVTAAKAVAECPGAVYNPLFVYGRSGLGKTHLLMAAAHAALATNPGLMVEYVTLDNLVDAFRAAIAAGQGDACRHRLLELDVLLVDDVQLLADHPELQVELLRLIDVFRASSRQIVLAGDRPPAEITSLDDALRQRFGDGLVIDVAAPDYEVAAAVARPRADEPVNDELVNTEPLEAAAEPVTPNAAEAAADLAGGEADEFGDFLAEITATVERLQAVREQPLSSPSPRWQLQDFAEGPANRIAVRSAYAVVAEPAEKYNPLVIVGAAGVGKTHLLHGIGNGLADLGVTPVACLTADDFVAQLNEVIDRNAVPDWRTRYRGTGALLLDDVQALAGKERAQEELLSLVKLCLEWGRQMVFTSPVPPAALTGIEAQLVTLLEGGLVMELASPDQAIRRRVVERMLTGRGGSPDAELVAYLANRPAESVREVQESVQRVLSAADAKVVAPNARLARHLLEGTATTPKRNGQARPAGIVGSVAGGLFSREKVIWDWPDVRDRIIEEWR